MLQMEKKIYELMTENHIMGEVVDYNDKMRMIAVEVIRGDWKHEHWRLDWMMKENFSDLRSVHTVTTEEDGRRRKRLLFCYSLLLFQLTE